MKAWKLSPIAIALVSAQSFAVEPTGLALGSGVTFLPSVKTSVESDSNIYSQATNETSDTVSRIAPSFALEANMGKLKINSLYTVEQGLYGKDENDDYLDQKFTFGSEYKINGRHELDLNASYNSAHDARGDGTIEGADADLVNPDEYNEVTAGINYIVGSDSSAANFDLYAETVQKRYDNNETFTTDREFDKVKLGGILSLTVSSATKILVEYRKTDVSYEADNNVTEQRAGEENKLLIGSSWDITGATTGEVKLGLATRSFDKAGIDSNTGFSWEANLTWQPLSYSTVTFSSSQSNNETSAAGSNLIDSRTTSIDWSHEFSPYYSAGVSTSYATDEYIGDSSVNGKERKDDNVSFGLNGTYSPLNWLDVNASVNLTDRDSNNNDLDAEGQVFNLGVTLAL